MFLGMSSTPQRILNTTDTCTTPKLTPVRFLQSPKTPLSSNLTDVKSRLEVIIASIQDNYEKWKSADKRGLALCNSIEAIKTRLLNEQKHSNSKLDAVLYPATLKPYCDQLAVILGIFVDIENNTRRALRQLQSLAKLPGHSNEIVYRTWQMDQFVRFVELLSYLYSKEYTVKKLVMEELPHCTERNQLIRHTTAWEYPQYIDDNVTLMFKFLAEEIKSNKS